MAAPIALEAVDSLELRPSSPFDFRHTIWKPSHFHTGLEQHSPTKSWRTFRIGDHLCGVVMTMTPAGTLQLDVYSGSTWMPEHSALLARRVTHSYGLDEDLAEFVQLASASDAMGHSLELFCGMRQSCPENLFEIAIISLLLQNATIARTTQMMNNLLTHYGHVVSFDSVTLRTFFTPKEIVSVTEERLREVDRLGYRAKYIGRFAEFFIEHDPDTFELTDKESLMTEFQTIKGVGPYTAAIIASHAVRDHSAIGLDVWNRKILARKLLGLDDAEAETVRAEMSRLFPGWEGLVGLYLVEEEYVENPASPLVHVS
jgi:3-methyladenine DNA glycosylase/8-oxoguanine DNA glycosylase